MERLTRFGRRTAAAFGLSVGAIVGYTAWMLNSPRRPWPPYTFTPFDVGVAHDGSLNDRG